MSEITELISEVEEIVREAGEAVLDVYAREFDVDHKDDPQNSPLTEADRTAHEIITTRLRDLTPDVPVISEESSENMEFENRKSFDRFWLVDPLDGTKEFIKKNDEFTINVGLVEGQEPAAGVVLVPVTNRVYRADGTGARLIEDGESKKLNVSTVRDPARATAVRSRSHGDPDLDKLLDNLGIKNILKRGSSLKLCRVAAGEVDVYARFGPTWEWDTAAADAVVRAAGGRVTEPDGNPVIYNKKSLKNPNGLVVTNGLLHERVVEAMR